MAVLEQEQISASGWPFGLQPFNTRLGGESFPWEDPRFFIASSSSFSSSSGLETQSTVSFFRDRSVTLGRLIRFTYSRSMSSSVRQSTASYNTQGMWVPHYKRKKKNYNSSWFEWLFKLMPCQSAKPNRHGNFHGGGSVPSLGQLLKLEELQGSSADSSGNVDLGYTDSAVKNVGDGECASSLHPSSALSSGEVYSHQHGSQTKSSTAALVEMKSKSATDDKSLAKAPGCMICFRNA